MQSRSLKMPRLLLVFAFCLTACTPARDCTAERQRAERAERQAADYKSQLDAVDADLLRLKQATDQPSTPSN